MQYLSLISALLVSAPVLAQTQSGTTPVTNALPRAADNIIQPPSGPNQTLSNPWDIVPPMVPYRNLADEIKAASKPGQASPLNPSCEGKTGDACVRSAEPPRR